MSEFSPSRRIRTSADTCHNRRRPEVEPSTVARQITPSYQSVVDGQRPNGIIPGLDAIRGIAAVLVALYHAPMLSPFGATKAYLAVDLFFVLSGYVLARAYAPQFDAGLTPVEFLAKRLRRLYPLYLASVAIAVPLILIKMTAGTIDARWQTVASLGANAAGLPSIFTDALYPLNVPAWSILVELGANAMLACSWPWLTKLRLAAVVATAAIYLSVVAVHHGSLSGGSEWTDLPLTIGRVAFSFPLGVLLTKINLSFAAIPEWLILGCIALIMLCDIQSAIFDLFCVVCVFPAIILCGISMPTSPFWSWMGQRSYGIYVLHVPILRWLTGATKGLEANWVVMLCGFMALVIAGSVVAEQMVSRRVQVKR